MIEYYLKQFKTNAGEERLFIKEGSTPRFSIHGLRLRNESKLKQMLKLEVGEEIKFFDSVKYTRVR
jgi:hypothetical protein